MDIEKLIERLRELSGTDNLSEFDDAATAISTLQTEAEGMRSNWYKSVEKIKELRAELEQARESLDFARTKDAEIVRMGKELEQAKAEITRLKYYEDKCHDCPIVCAKTEIIKAHEELEAVQAELERVKQEKDAAVDCINQIQSARDHTRPAYVVDKILSDWRGPKEV